MSTAFTDAAAALAFATAGRATLTLASAKGGRYTYRLRRSTRGALFVDVLTGADNESSYTPAGILDGARVRSTRAARIGADAPSVRALEWTMRHLQAGAIPAALSVYHDGRCGHCARKLTTPESLESGFGPVCREKA